MPTQLVVTTFNIRLLRLNNKEIFPIKLKYFLSLNNDIPVLTKVNAKKSDWERAALDIYRFELSNHSYYMTEPEIDGPRRRGILVLPKKNLGLKMARIEELNYNLVKICLEHTIMKMTIYGCYGHSDGDKHEYFLDLR